MMRICLFRVDDNLLVVSPVSLRSYLDLEHHAIFNSPCYTFYSYVRSNRSNSTTRTRTGALSLRDPYMSYVIETCED